MVLALAPPAGARAGEGGPAPPAQAQTLEDFVAGLDPTGTPAGPDPGGNLPAPAAPAGEPRPVPNLEGRPPPSPTAAEIAAWPARVLFFPVYVVMEWGVRQPTLAILTLVDEHELVERAIELFTWDERQAALFPVLGFETGAHPTVGLAFFWKNLGPADAQRVDAGVSLWGDDRLVMEGSYELRFSPALELSLRSDYQRRPDNRVWVTQDPTDRCVMSEGCRYRSNEGAAGVELVFRHGIGRLTGATRYRHVELGIDGATSPPLSAAEAQRLPGFGDYDLVELDLLASLDTRSPDLVEAPDTGLGLEVDLTGALDPGSPEMRFVRLRAEAMGALDLGHHRVLALRLITAHLIDLSQPGAGSPAAQPPVPFTEHVVLGGSEDMRGFPTGLLRGLHAWTAGVEYRYSVHAYADATLFVEVGNAYPSLEAWDFDASYLSYGIALRSRTSRDVAVQALLGFSSDRFDQAQFDLWAHTRASVAVVHAF